MQFPQITSQSLNKTTYTLPQDLSGEYNIVIIPFLQYHQQIVNTWLPYLEQLIEEWPQINYYELPTIQNRNFLSRRFIDSGMRGGIRDKETKERTITLYTDLDWFTSQLEISNRDDIYIYLIDKGGNILATTTGRYDPSKFATLVHEIQKLMLSN